MLLVRSFRKIEIEILEFKTISGLHNNSHETRFNTYIDGTILYLGKSFSLRYC